MVRGGRGVPLRRRVPPPHRSEHLDEQERSPAPRNTAGLFHLAILYPERRDLAQALRWLLEANYPIDGASDHGVSEALYLRDPDGNGVELATDRPEEEWPRAGDGKLAMVTRPLDVEGLLAELDEGEYR